MATTRARPRTPTPRRAQAERKAAEALLDLLVANGVERVWANLGTDYPAVIEAFARYAAEGRPAPQVVICPHEMVLLSAAQGAAQVSGAAQVCFLHVDVGTQNVGGALHNVYRSRLPILLLAGRSPWTAEGELRGSRDHWIQYYQDHPDQHGIVRGYVKWDYEARTAANLAQVVQRAFRIALDEPRGPIYLSLAREVLEQPAPPAPFSPERYAPSVLGVPDPATLDRIADRLVTAREPLIVTSDLGRRPAAVAELVRLAETLGAPVAQSYPSTLNFPTDHPLHWGFQSEPHLAGKDVILTLDAEVPWLPARGMPDPETRVIQLDVDPARSDFAFWAFPSDLAVRADSLATLPLLTAALERRLRGTRQIEKVQQRTERCHAVHDQQRQLWAAEAERAADSAPITPQWLSHELNAVLAPEALLFEDAVTNKFPVLQAVERTRPATYFGCGGAALGYGIGAAFGAKLAQPDEEVVCVTGDGAYLFGVPTVVYWAARRYQAPFLTVIYNNIGWGAVRLVTQLQYPEGFAKAADRYLAGFAPSADLTAPAAASGAHVETVTKPDQVRPALERGLAAVRAGQAAVVDVRIVPVEQE